MKSKTHTQLHILVSHFFCRISNRHSRLLLLLLSWLSCSHGGLSYAVNNSDHNPRSVASSLKGGSTRKLRKYPSALPSDISIRQLKVANHVAASSAVLRPPIKPLLHKTLFPGKDETTKTATPILTREFFPQPPPLVKSSAKTTTSAIEKVDVIVALIYFCNAFAITLPVILTPMAAKTYLLSPSQLTSFCGVVASVGIMGGGFGKVVNGIVCQRLGGVRTASYYLLGAGLCSLLLSMSTSIDSVKWLVAGMEFFSSAMWVACSLVLSNHYAKEPISFARGITYLSLASTTAQLLAKTVGSAMLQVMDWRAVAQIGAMMTILGSLVTRFVLAKEVVEPRSRLQWIFRPSEETNVLDQIKSVLGNPLFWAVGLGHVPGFIARTCDRMLGPFLADVTSLPYPICGGLTAAVTIGFLRGVVNGKSFYALESVQEKEAQLKSWYLRAVSCMLGLAFLAGKNIRSSIPPPVMAALVVWCSGNLASSSAFQFFQIPNMVSSVAFSENKALCLSFLDGVGFFLTAPLWTLGSQVATSLGWSAAWGSLAVVVGFGGALMVKSMKPVLVKHAKEAG